MHNTFKKVGSLALASALTMGSMAAWPAAETFAATHTKISETSDSVAQNAADIESSDAKYAFTITPCSSTQVTPIEGIPSSVSLTTERGKFGYNDASLFFYTDDPSASGKVGAWMTNVGTLNGQQVDLKATFSWDPNSIDKSKGIGVYGAITARLEAGYIGTWFGPSNVTVKYELYNKDHTQKITPAGMNVKLNDIDYGQCFGFRAKNNNGQDAIDTVQYLDPVPVGGTNVSNIVNYHEQGDWKYFYADGTPSNNGDESGIRLELSNTNTFEVKILVPYDSRTETEIPRSYYAGNKTYSYDLTDAVRNTSNRAAAEISQTAKKNVADEDHQALYNDSSTYSWVTFLAKAFKYYSGEIPEKGVEANTYQDLVGDEQEEPLVKENAEEVSYTVSHHIPYEPQADWYQSYVMKDQLDPALTYVDSRIESQGEDVTDLFTISEKDGVLTAKAKNPGVQSFYNKQYDWIITAKLNADHINKNWDDYAVEAGDYSADAADKMLAAVNNSAKVIVTRNDNDVSYESDSVPVYYEKDAVVTVKYVDEDKKELKEDTGDNSGETLTGKVGDKYETTEKSFFGYELTETPNNAEGKMKKEPTEVTYVYKLKDAKLIVKHVDADDEDKELADGRDETLKYFKGYKTDPAEIKGYNLTATPANAEGTIKEDETTVIYKYTKKDTSVTANYVDEDGNQLAPSETFTGKFKDPYETSEKEIPGYQLTEMPDNAEGEMDEDPITVTYVYAKKPTEVNVEYVNEDGKEIETPEKIDGVYQDPYKTEAKEIYGYELTVTPDNAQGKMDEDPITVTYIYKLKKADLVVHHVDESGNKLADDVTKEGKVFEKYATEAVNIPGYELTTTPENATGKYAEERTTVTYVYKLKDSKVIAHYVDEDGNVLHDPETTKGKYNDTYSLSGKKFIGYELTKTPENAKGNMGVEPIDVTFVYKLKDASVIVKYVDEDGKELTGSETITGKVFDKYQTGAKGITGYKLTQTPSNASGNMTEDVITVTYVYKKYSPVTASPATTAKKATTTTAKKNTTTATTARKTTTTPAVKKAEKKTAKVKTGDSNAMLIFIGAGIVLALAALAFFFRKKPE